MRCNMQWYLYGILHLSNIPPHGNIAQSLAKRLPQRLINRKYKRRTRCRPCDRNSTTPIQSPQSMLFPQSLPRTPECPPCRSSTSNSYFLSLHARFNSVRRVEDEVITHTRRRAGKHLIRYRYTLLRTANPPHPSRRSLNSLITPKPRSRSARLTYQSPQLTMPESQRSVVCVHGGDDGAGAGEAWDACAGVYGGDLHFAFYEFDGCEEEGGECA